MAKKSSTKRFSVKVTHIKGNDPTSHVGRFASKQQAVDHFQKKHPDAHKIDARMC